MKKLPIILIIFFVFISMCNAQDTLPFSGKTYYNWYFGIDAGITFNTPDKEPIFLEGTIIGGGQNSSTISDKQGNFLFHTQGQYLENYKYQFIDKDMGGNGSQSEGSVLAPLNGGKFIFFTTVFANNVYTDDFDPPRWLLDSTGLLYSIFSYDSTTNKLTYFKHKVQLDKNFLSEAIELTYSAITNKYILVCPDTKGMISAYEFDLDGNYLRHNTQKFFELMPYTNSREIRINQMGDKVAVSSTQGLYRSKDGKVKRQYSHLYIANLDAKTLQFSNYIDLELKGYGASYMEFSSNSNFLYFYGSDTMVNRASNETLLQYNLRDLLLTKIYSAPFPKSNDYRYGNILVLDSSIAAPTELRIAPNHKIYICRMDGNHLSSIEAPNNGISPGYKLHSVYLEKNYGKQTYGMFTLPSILSASFAPVYVRSEIILCEGEDLELFAKTQLPDPEATYSWDGPNNYTSDEQFPVIENIQLSQAGLYTVTVHSHDKTYKAETFVRVKPSPKPVLRAYPKAFLCEAGTITLSLSEDYESYLWTTGDTTKLISVTKSGNYGVTVTSANGCTAFTEMKISFANDYKIAITGDTLKCKGEAVTLTCKNEYPEYSWSNGATTRSITVTEPGAYTLTVTTEEGCKVSRTITVKDYPEVRAELNPTPTTICSGDSTLLESKYDVPYYSYEWNTGDTTRGIYVSQTGTYKLTITDTRTGCTGSTEIAIKVEDKLVPTITGSNICSGETATLTALPNDPSYTYQWSNGETTPVIEVSQAGTYTVTVSKGGCVGTAEFTVNESPRPEFEILGENIICNNETATLTCSKDFAEYYWSTNEVSKSIEVATAGTYTLTVTDSNGCSASKSFTVSKYKLDFTLSKGSIDFGKTYITETKEDKTTLTNNSGFAITLASGQVVADGQSYDYDYSFVPAELGAFSDAITVHITKPCDTLITIPITATVYARVTISTVDIHTQIGREETVPVYLECEADLKAQDYTITTDIDKSVFYTMDSYTVSQTQPINQAKTQIHELTGTILLSEALEYDITFPSYDFTNPYIEVLEKPGRIYIDSICIFPLRRVISLAPTTLELSPNPASGELTIDITTGMQGTMNLELVSSEGRVIYTQEWQQSTRSKELKISTSTIPSGLYQVRLITPYDAVTKTVVVVE